MKIWSKVIIVLAVVAVGGWAIWRFGIRGGRAGIQIETGVVVMDVYLNGQKVGETPFLDESLNAGAYQLMLRGPSGMYADYQRRVNLSEGFLTVVVWKPGTTVENSGGVFLEPKKWSGSGERTEPSEQAKVVFSSAPDQVIVQIDGMEESLTTPDEIILEARNYNLKFSLPSYKTLGQEIRLVEDEIVTVFVKMAKEG